MRRSVYSLLICAYLGALPLTTLGQIPPLRNGYTTMPDEILLAQRLLPWSYAIAPSPNPVLLSTRQPSISEARVISRARTMFVTREAKALALLDGPNIVYVEYKAPANEKLLFYSVSMGKTVTSMAVGQAICAGKLKLDDHVKDWMPEVTGKALGNATVRDLLRMASGTVVPVNPENSLSGNILTPQDYRDWNAGTLNLVEVLSRDQVARAARGVFSDYVPGETFVYKGTDPLTLGILLNRERWRRETEHGWKWRSCSDGRG